MQMKKYYLIILTTKNLLITERISPQNTFKYTAAYLCSTPSILFSLIKQHRKETPQCVIELPNGQFENITDFTYEKSNKLFGLKTPDNLKLWI